VVIIMVLLCQLIKGSGYYNGGGDYYNGGDCYNTGGNSYNGGGNNMSLDDSLYYNYDSSPYSYGGNSYDNGYNYNSYNNDCGPVVDPIVYDSYNNYSPYCDTGYESYNNYEYTSPVIQPTSSSAPCYVPQEYSEVVYQEPCATTPAVYYQSTPQYVPQEQPCVYEQPVYTPQPVYTQQPVYVEQPVYTQQPTVYPQPVIYEQQPVYTQQPVYVEQQQPVYTPQPVYTQSTYTPPVYTPQAVCTQPLCTPSQQSYSVPQAYSGQYQGSQQSSGEMSVLLNGRVPVSLTPSTIQVGKVTYAVEGSQSNPLSQGQMLYQNDMGNASVSNLYSNQQLQSGMGNLTPEEMAERDNILSAISGANATSSNSTNSTKKR